jgi:hypothetical protein
MGTVDFDYGDVAGEEGFAAARAAGLYDDDEALAALEGRVDGLERAITGLGRTLDTVLEALDDMRDFLGDKLEPIGEHAALTMNHVLHIEQHAELATEISKRLYDAQFGATQAAEAAPAAQQSKVPPKAPTVPRRIPRLPT